MKYRAIVFATCAAVVTLGCQPGANTDEHTEGERLAKEKHAGHEHAEGATCSECAESTSQILHPEVTTHKGPDGQVVTHAGMALAGAEAVTVAALLADPEAYAGKTVKVSGNVSAMCKHKRAWFAVVGDDQSGNHVRVFTAPNFLVPHESIGKSAVAEGRVEVIEVPVDRARHLAEKHKLSEPEDIKAPVKRVLIRATGADFS